MRGSPHHLVVWTVLLLAACQPSWESKVPVGYERAGPLQVQRPATVTVYAGDTVFSIARRYSLPVRDLIELNGLKAPYTLTQGQVIRLPGGDNGYVVQKGDSLSVIARKLRVDFNALAAVNNKRPPYTLQVGERLTMPGARPLASQPAERLASAQPKVPATGSFPNPSSPPNSTQASPQVSPAPAIATPSAVPEPPARSGTVFLWPVKGEVVAVFGPLPGKGQHNDGINIAAPKGTAIKAADNGTVAYVGNELKGFGNLLLIKHAGGWMTAYAHNEKMMVKRGDVVKRGQTIATVGQTGNVSLPQLHFEIRHGTEAVDPTEHLS